MILYFVRSVKRWTEIGVEVPWLEEPYLVQRITTKPQARIHNSVEEFPRSNINLIFFFYIYHNYPPSERWKKNSLYIKMNERSRNQYHKILTLSKLQTWTLFLLTVLFAFHYQTTKKKTLYSLWQRICDRIT